MKKKFILGATLSSVLFVAACTGTPPSENATGTPGETDASAPATGETFRYLYNTNIVTDLDPSLHQSSELIALHNVYEMLTFYNTQTEEVEPLLAESWTTSDDGLEWTFKIREDAFFHSGRQVDAQAVKESIDRTIDVGSPLAYIWDSLDEITVESEFEAKFILTEAAPLDLITSAGYGAYIFDLEASGDEDFTEWTNAGNDAGSGPYTIADFNPGGEVELRLEAVPDYRDGWNDNQFTAIDFIVSPEQTTSWQMMQNGEADFMFNLQSELFEQAQTVDAVEAIQTPSFTNLFAQFNTAGGPLAEVNVRKALMQTLNFDEIESLLNGAGTAASGIIPEGLIGYSKGRTPTQDLDAAAALLAESGYGPDGEPITLTVTYEEGNQVIENIAVYWTSVLADLNISLDIQQMQWSAVWDVAKATDPEQRQDILLSGWWPDYPDARSWYASMIRSVEGEPYFNLTYLEDPELDEIIDSLPLLQATDPAAEAEAHEKIHDLVLDEHAAMLPILVYNMQRVINSEISGYVDNPLYANAVRLYHLER